MDTQLQRGTEESYIARAIEVFVRLGSVALLVALCFEIVRPFILPLVWGIIIAIGSHSAYCKLRALLGERQKLAAVLFTLLTLIAVLVPIALLTESLVSGARAIVLRMEGRTLAVPPPPVNIQTWPLIGKPIFTFWTLASQDLPAAAGKFKPQIEAGAKAVMASAAGVGRTVFYLILAFAIAGLLLAHTQACARSSLAVAQRLFGSRGQALLSLIEATIQNVFQGILGVAAIQAVMAGLGFVVVGVPAAGLWSLVAFILAVIQIGVWLVTIPIVIYVFVTSGTLTAVLFLIWNALILVIDNFLKPILMKRGAKVPVPVIFVGALGGFISMGIIGLFVGAVVLAVGYELARAWLYKGSPSADNAHAL